MKCRGKLVLKEARKEKTVNQRKKKKQNRNFTWTKPFSESSHTLILPNTLPLSLAHAKH